MVSRSQRSLLVFVGLTLAACVGGVHTAWQVGVCAGAFLALAHYRPERSLKLLDAHAVMPWKRGQATIGHSFVSPRPCDAGGVAVSRGGERNGEIDESCEDDEEQIEQQGPILWPVGSGRMAQQRSGGDGVDFPARSRHGGGGQDDSVDAHAAGITDGDSLDVGDGDGGGGGGGGNADSFVALRYHNGPLMVPGPAPAEPLSGTAAKAAATISATLPPPPPPPPPSAISTASKKINNSKKKTKNKTVAVAPESHAIPSPVTPPPGTMQCVAVFTEDAELPGQAGQCAVARGVCGDGRVLLISAHPESTRNESSVVAEEEGEEEDQQRQQKHQDGGGGGGGVADEMFASNPQLAAKLRSMRLGDPQYGRIIQRAVSWVARRR